MQYIFILIYILLGFMFVNVSSRSLGKRIHANSVFTIVWCVCASLASLGVAKLYPPSFETHLATIISIIVLNVAYLFTYSRTKRQQKPVELTTGITGQFNMKLVLTLNILAWLYCLSLLPRAISMITRYSFSDFRAFAFSASTDYASTAQLTIVQNIVQPIFTVTALAAIVSIVCSKQSTRSLIILVIINSILLTLITAGRSSITEILYFSFFALLVSNHKLLGIVKLTFKRYRKMSVFVIAAILAALILTNLRSGTGSSAINQLLLYHCGPFSFLSELIKRAPWEGALLYGKAMFGFIVSIFYMAATLIFGFEYGGGEYFVTQITSIRQVIGDGVSFNALGTMIFPFLMDFGWIGVLIGPAFCGFVIASIERWFYRSRTLVSLCIYIYILQNTFSLVKNYYFFAPSAGFTVILIYYIINNKKRKKKQLE